MIYGEKYVSHMDLGYAMTLARNFLPFFARNESIICNTWFKKDIHKQTWQHPKSKALHRLCHFRRQDRKRCLDATVKCGVQH